MTALVRAARDAASEAADLKRQAARIDPYIPLAVWPMSLHELDLALSSLSSGLYLASHLASDAIGRQVQPRHEATPGSLAIASTPAEAAAEHANGALNALLAAGRSGEPDLAALADVARQQSAILADLSHTCYRFHYGIAEACERTPNATNSKTTRISGPLRRASVTLKKAAAGASHAAADLDDELNWGRRTASAW